MELVPLLLCCLLCLLELFPDALWLPTADGACWEKGVNWLLEFDVNIPEAFAPVGNILDDAADVREEVNEVAVEEILLVLTGKEGLLC